MKTRFIPTAALALSFCALTSSCGDKKSDADTGNKPTETGAQQDPSATKEAKVDLPPQEAVRNSLPAVIKECAFAEIADVKISPKDKTESGLAVDLSVTLKMKDDLYRKAPVPEELARLRSSVNPIVLEALQPDACYFLMAGEEQNRIPKEAEEVFKPEQAVQTLIDEILALASPENYAKAAAAGDTFDLQGSAKVNKNEDGTWTISEVAINTQKLADWDGSIIKDLVPAHALDQTAETGSARADQLKEKIAALQTAAKTQNATRERKILEQVTKAAALREAEAKASAAREEKQREEAQKEAATKAAAEKEKQAGERKRFLAAFGSGESYVGEWACGTQTGKLSLVIMSCDASEKSAIVEATLADPYLDGAIMELKGRIVLAPDPSEPYRILLTIIGGSFDPDSATANIYRRSDGLLKLNLQEDGTLQGTMTCPEWDEKDKKTVKVFLRSETAMQKEKSDKKTGKKK